MARLCAELAMLHRAKYRDYRRWRDGHRAWVQEYGMRPVPPTGAVILRIRPSVFIAPIVMEVPVIEPPPPATTAMPRQLPRGLPVLLQNYARRL